MTEKPLSEKTWIANNDGLIYRKGVYWSDVQEAVSGLEEEIFEKYPYHRSKAEIQKFVKKKIHEIFGEVKGK